MTEIKGFIMSLIAVSAASALLDGFTPDGGVKKYFRYLVSLLILIVLLTPVRGIIGKIPSAAAGYNFSYDSVEAFVSANSVVAMHIERALAEKFSLEAGTVSVKYDGEKMIVRAKKRLGFVESDFEAYISGNFGVLSEVEFYE